MGSEANRHLPPGRPCLGLGYWGFVPCAPNIPCETFFHAHCFPNRRRVGVTLAGMRIPVCFGFSAYSHWKDHLEILGRIGHLLCVSELSLAHGRFSRGSRMGKRDASNLGSRRSRCRRDRCCGMGAAVDFCLRWAHSPQGRRNDLAAPVPSRGISRRLTSLRKQIFDPSAPPSRAGHPESLLLVAPQCPNRYNQLRPELS